MMDALDKFRKLYNAEKTLDDYCTFLRFPSVSTDPAYRKELLRCVEWLEERIKKSGFSTTLWPTEEGIPVLFAEWLGAGPDKPTVLIYNHYDVQPPDPLELWESPPFEPRISGETVYCRGAQDNKGQCSYVLAALDLLFSHYQGRLPVNVKWCIEGEEECGSSGFAKLLEEKSAALAADALVVADMGIPSKELPAVVLGIRGIVTMEVRARGSKVDLHSGTHGGVAYNPIHALVGVLAQLRDANGRVTVPGFYDAVSPAVEKLPPFDHESYHSSFGAKATGGELQFPPEMRHALRPTLEINGIWGGYTGQGFKTVIPAVASAKISCRLVPDQEPATIAAAVKRKILSLAPPGIELEVELHEGGGPAVRSSPEAVPVQAFGRAYSEVFGKECLHIYNGGSIPIVSKLAAVSGAEIVMMGLGLADDNIHAPNEQFSIDRLEKGALIVARALELLADKA